MGGVTGKRSVLRRCRARRERDGLKGGATGGGRGALGEARLNVACWSAERST